MNVETFPTGRTNDASILADTHEALAAARLRDPFGHQLHTVLAMAYMLLLPIEMSPGDVAFGLLAAWTCARLHHTWRTYAFMVRSPAVWLWLAWAAWQATSLLWSSDIVKGRDELASCRVLALPLLLWPVLDRLPWLIAASLVGVLEQNRAQMFQAIGWMAPREQDPADRFAGHTHAIKTATWCCAAMCWNLSATLRGSGLWRWMALIMLVAASIGLVLSGSRGPWIAAAAAVPLMLLTIAIRRPALRRGALIMLAGGIIAVAAAWPVAKSKVLPRIDDAFTEYRQAIEQHKYWTSVGMRIGMWRWSAEIFREHPLFGVGAGGFDQAKQQQDDFQQAWDDSRSDHQRKWLSKDHPHSIVLYALTCTGLVGLAVLILALAATFRQTWNDRADHAFSDGTFFAVLAWFIGAQFDSYILSGQLFGMVSVLVAVSLPGRAVIRLVISAKNDSRG